MDIEIRRNRGIKFDFEISNEQRESILDLFKPKVIDEMVEQMLDENNRIKREICEKIMSHCVEIGQRDINGELITPDTHEVGFDLGFVNVNGDTWAYPKQWYVRPKKSEYEK